jgi:hypothetical protein
MRDKIYKEVTGIVAILLVALAVAPAAFADSSPSPRATSSAAKVSVALTKLKTQVAALRQQVKALEAQNGPRTPTGPAGGDLAGVFPNPLIGPNAVGAPEIQSNAVGADELQDNAVGTGEIVDGGVAVNDLGPNVIDGGKISDGTVGVADLAFDSVGSNELQPLTAHISTGVTITASGGPQDAQITCPESRMLIAGGYAWTKDEGNAIIASAPSETNPSTTWVVRGKVDAGSNTLFAWATCLLG